MTLVHRVLFVAWQNPGTRRIHPVARLVHREEEPVWEFVYLQGAREAAASGFVPFPGLRWLDLVYRSEELPPLFANRLMPRSRADRAAFLARLGLGEEAAEIPILARSEGLKATDTVELYGLPSFDAEHDRYRFFFFVRGLRYVPGAEERVASLRTGQRLALVPDPDNTEDRLAIVVQGGSGASLGWVPRTLVEDVHRLGELGSRIELSAERINDRESPVQLRLLCRLEASAVEGYTPFSSERYRPIPSGATPIKTLPRELVG